MNVKYLLSSRFTGYDASSSVAMISIFSIIKCFVANVHSDTLLDEAKIVELL